MKDHENTLSLSYVERIYAAYLDDRERVSAQWREYFDKMDGSGSRGSNRFGPSFRPASIFNPPSTSNGSDKDSRLRLARLQERVDLLVRNYRVRGHIMAKLDPLGRVRSRPAELDPEFYGFNAADLDCAISATTIRG